MTEAREGLESVEIEKQPQSTIRLEFFRHDEEGKNLMPDRSDDNTIRLTDKGREGSENAGKLKNPHPEVAIAGGSSRIRSVEAALHQMLSKTGKVNPQTTLEEVRAMISEQLNQKGKKTSKEIVTDRLNFFPEFGTPFADKYMEHYNAKNAMKFLFDESDELVKTLGDPNPDSYSLDAGKVAEIVQKYLAVLPVWQRINSENPEKYKQFGYEMQRFLGSHQGYIECLMLKIIEKTVGREAAQKVLDSIPANGFNPSEGYSIVLETKDQKRQIRLKYHDQEWIVDPKVIDEIIKEKDELLELIKENNK